MPELPNCLPLTPFNFGDFGNYKFWQSPLFPLFLCVSKVLAGCAFQHARKYIKVHVAAGQDQTHFAAFHFFAFL